MIKFNFKNIKITGIAAAVPKKEINIDMFSSKFGEETVQKFKNMTGVSKLHHADENQTASDLGYVAARELMLKKDIDPETIDALIFVSQTPDYKTPATACVLHKRLGLSKDCPAIDINLGCSGYVYGIQTIGSWMQSSNIEKALLIVGDTVSKMVSHEDRSAAMLFGDAGSATFLEKDESAFEMSGGLRTKGDGYRSIITQGGSYRNPDASYESTVWEDGNMRSEHNLYMNGMDVFSFTVAEVPSLIKEFMMDEKTSPDNYDCLVMHQANLFILKQIAKKSKFPMGKVPISIGDYGNTSVASIPLTLVKMCNEGYPLGEIRTLMTGFGVGLSWGVLSARIETASVLPIIYTDEHYTDGGIKHD